MELPGDWEVKITNSFFISDLKVYKESHEKLELLNQILVKSSMHTGTCYDWKKYADVVSKEGKMVKGEGLRVPEEKMKALDPDQNDVNRQTNYCYRCYGKS